MYVKDVAGIVGNFRVQSQGGVHEGVETTDKGLQPRQDGNICAA